jgi:Kyanoviridae DNA polymerase
MNPFYTNVEAIGNKIHVREIDSSGNPNYRKIRYSPELFVSSGKPSKFKTLSGDNLQKVEFEDMRSAKDWVKEFDGVDNFEFFGMTRFQYAALSDLFPQEHLEYDITKIRILFLDIETESENGFAKATDPQERINLITITDLKSKKTYSFGLGKFVNAGDPNVTYQQFDDEMDLLQSFMKTWKELNPDIVSGWWISGFDIPYLVNRINMLFEEGIADKYLSPYGRLKATTFTFKGQKEVPTYDIMGVSVLDYQRIYGKFVLEPRENFKLNYICELELGIGKLDYTEYDNFADFYRQDWQKFTEYNIRDVDLVVKLEGKLKLIELVLQVAYDAKCNFQDVLSQVRVWDCKVYNALKRKGIQIPQLTRTSKSEKYEGAFVKVPKPGAYKWIVSYDVASLYPNIIRTLNIGTETKIKKIPKINQHSMLGNDENFENAYREAFENSWTLAANGTCYSKTLKSFYSVLIEEMFNNRKTYQVKIKEAKKLVSEIDEEIKQREVKAKS